MKKVISLLTLSSLLFALPMAVTVIDGSSPLASAAHAEEKKEPKYKDVKTRQRQAVGRKCAKSLEGIQVMLEEENWPEALENLKRVDASDKTCESDYEQTQVWKFMGYVYYSLDDMRQAINLYKRVVAGVGTPPELRLDTRYTLAQLYTVQEDYKNAAAQLEAWISESTIVGSDAKVLLAQIYFQLDRKAEALALVEEAIGEYEARGELPKEGWWSLQRVLYYEKNDYKKVASILENLVTHYPSWSYWRQLGGMYGELERETDRLVATEVVYLNNQLETESQVMSMGYMYLGAGVPYRAAKIVERGIQEEKVEPSLKNLEVLGTAWYQAKELKRALTALEAASKKAKDGNIQARLAGLYLDLGNDQASYNAAVKAAKQGKVKKPDANYMLMGNALVNMHCYKDAIDAFKKSIKAAGDDKKAKRYPQQWIQYAEAEGDRLDKLRKAGAQVPSCRKVS